MSRAFLVGLQWVLFIFLLFPSPTHGQMPTTYAEWQREYEKCFDRNDDLVPSQIVTLKKNLQEALRSLSNDTHLLLIWAELTTLTADWKNAEQASRQLLQLKSTEEQRQTARRNLAGIAAMQRRWGEAAIHYGHYSILGVKHRGLPAFCVCLIWLLLEIQIKKETHAQPYSRREIRNLLLLACLPLLFAVFWNFGRLLNSLCFFGNAGAALTSYKIASIVTLSVSIEWALLSLYLARRIKKRWLVPTPAAAETPPAERPKDSKIVSVLKSLATLLGGFFMLNFYHTPVLSRFVETYSDWSAEFVRSFQSWFGLISMLTVVILSPIAQEILFRGAIFQYVKQAGGRSSAFIFSSILFAGIHFNQADRFASLVFVGLVFCLQMEVRSRLTIPILTHCIANFMLFLLSESR
jgi:membrane protease YdiL (CAAX protease family)